MTKLAKIDAKQKLELAKREAEDAVFAELDHQQEIEINENFKQDAHMALGMIAAVPSVLKSINAHLSSKHLLALREFQERKFYKAFGYDNFADFLTHSPHSPMTKSKYFERLNLLLKEGEETYDLLNEIGISKSDRKRLPPNSVRIVGDEILVNDTAVPIGSSTEVKAVVNDLIRNWDTADKAEKQAIADKEKVEKEVEQLKERIAQGQDEYQELQRAFDAMNEGDPHDKALLRLIGAFVKMNEQARDLPVVEKVKRADNVLHAVWVQITILRRTYGRDNFTFEDVMNPQTPDGISDLAKHVLAEDDDFGDENE